MKHRNLTCNSPGADIENTGASINLANKEKASFESNISVDGTATNFDA